MPLPQKSPRDMGIVINMPKDKVTTKKANPEIPALLFQSLISNLNETEISILKADAMLLSERRKGWKRLCFAPFLVCFGHRNVYQNWGATLNKASVQLSIALRH